MDSQNPHRYDDIIGLPRPLSTAHPQMDAASRAAQFAPFAALTGHEAAIRETARQADEMPALDEDRKRILDGRLRLIAARLAEQPEITVTYFRPDGKKAGGALTTVTARVRNIDAHARTLHLTDGVALPIERITALTGAFFAVPEVPPADRIPENL